MIVSRSVGGRMGLVEKRSYFNSKLELLLALKEVLNRIFCFCKRVATQLVHVKNRYSMFLDLSELHDRILIEDLEKEEIQSEIKIQNVHSEEEKDESKNSFSVLDR